MGGKDAVDRFLNWKLPPAASPDDEDAGGGATVTTSPSR
jgi:hypothetical protein